MSNHKSSMFDASQFHQTHKPVGIYWLVLTVLATLILMTGASIALQSQERHRTYRELQALKQRHTELKSEEQRLFIEQQTFGSTSEVVRLSVDKLGMFFPAKQNRDVITSTANQTPKTPTTQGETKP